MKSIKYIVLSLLFLSFFSCQKELIKPCDINHDTTQNYDGFITIDSQENQERSSLNLKSSNASGSSSSSSNDDGSNDDNSNDEGGITDPNNDPDSNKKKGGKL
jgi:hypothetical protein